jgi:hypothetical protein
MAFEIRVQLPDFRASATVVNAALKYDRDWHPRSQGPQ